MLACPGLLSRWLKFSARIERDAGGFAQGLAPCERLPAPDGDIDVARLDLDQPGLPSRVSTPEQNCIGGPER